MSEINLIIAIFAGNEKNKSRYPSLLCNYVVKESKDFSQNEKKNQKNMQWKKILNDYWGLYEIVGGWLGDG